MMQPFIAPGNSTVALLSFTFEVPGLPDGNFNFEFGSAYAATPDGSSVDAALYVSPLTAINGTVFTFDVSNNVAGPPCVLLISGQTYFFSMTFSFKVVQEFPTPFAGTNPFGIPNAWIKFGGPQGTYQVVSDGSYFATATFA